MIGRGCSAVGSVGTVLGPWIRPVALIQRSVSTHAATDTIITIDHLQRITSSLIDYRPNAIQHIGEAATNVGGKGKALVVCSKSAMESGRARIVQHYLQDYGFQAFLFGVPDGIASVESTTNAVALAHRTGCDSVVGFGGGTMLDLAKLVSALATNGGQVKEFVPDLGGKRRFETESLPLVLVPTCPSGAELKSSAMTLFNQLASFEVTPHSSSSRVAIVDPTLATSLSPTLTCTQSLATAVHAIETMMNPEAHRACQELSRYALSLVVQHLPDAIADGNNLESRAALAEASMYSSAALSVCTAGASRGLAISIASKFAVRYADTMTAVAPEVLDATIAILEEDGNSDAIERVQRVAAIVTGDDGAEPEDLVQGFRDLFGDFEVPSLEAYGLTPVDVQNVANAAEVDPNTLSNAAPLPRSELCDIVEHS